jgi:hypothetical protein
VSTFPSPFELGARRRTDILPRVNARYCSRPNSLMFALLPFGATAMGRDVPRDVYRRGMRHTNSKRDCPEYRSGSSFAQIRPALTGAVLRAAGVYVIVSCVVHARHAHGSIGVGLLIFDFARSGDRLSRLARSGLASLDHRVDGAWTTAFGARRPLGFDCCRMRSARINQTAPADDVRASDGSAEVGEAQ